MFWKKQNKNHEIDVDSILIDVPVIENLYVKHIDY